MIGKFAAYRPVLSACLAAAGAAAFAAAAANGTGGGFLATTVRFLIGLTIAIAAPTVLAALAPKRALWRIGFGIAVAAGFLASPALITNLEPWRILRGRIVRRRSARRRYEDCRGLRLYRHHRFAHVERFRTQVAWFVFCGGPRRRRRRQRRGPAWRFSGRSARRDDARRRVGGGAGGPGRRLVRRRVQSRRNGRRRGRAGDHARRRACRVRDHGARQRLGDLRRACRRRRLAILDFSAARAGLSRSCR